MEIHLHINKTNKIFTGKLKEIYDNTKGAHNSPDEYECYLLYEIARHQKGNVLEIGVWKGRSASFLAEAIKDTNRKLYLVDWFQGDSTGGENPSKEEVQKALKEYEYTLFDQDMYDVDYSQIKGVDFVFYDSDHNTKPTVDILSKIHPYLEENTIVCIHDAGWEMTQKAIKELEEKYRLQYFVNVWEGFVILKKVV